MSIKAAAGDAGHGAQPSRLEPPKAAMRKLSDVILDQKPLILSETASVQEACRAMREHEAGSVLVVDAAGRLAGIFTGRDAVCRVVAEGRPPATTGLGQVMTRNPLTLEPHKTAIDALRLMTNNPNKVNAFDKWRVLYRVDEQGCSTLIT